MVEVEQEDQGKNIDQEENEQIFGFNASVCIWFKNKNQYVSNKILTSCQPQEEEEEEEEEENNNNNNGHFYGA